MKTMNLQLPGARARQFTDRKALEILSRALYAERDNIAKFIVGPKRSRALSDSLIIAEEVLRKAGDQTDHVLRGGRHESGLTFVRMVGHLFPFEDRRSARARADLRRLRPQAKK